MKVSPTVYSSTVALFLVFTSYSGTAYGRAQTFGDGGAQWITDDIVEAFDEGSSQEIGSGNAQNSGDGKAQYLVEGRSLNQGVGGDQDEGGSPQYSGDEEISDVLIETLNDGGTLELDAVVPRTSESPEILSDTAIRNPVDGNPPTETKPPPGSGMRGIDLVMLLRGVVTGTQSWVGDWWSSLTDNLNSPAEIWEQGSLFSPFTSRRRKRAASGTKCKKVCGVAPPRVGMHQRSKRVVNGTRSPSGQWPWMVSIYLKDKYERVTNSCGGALIDRDIVMSASHCFRDPAHNWTANADRLFVRVGTNRNPYDDYIDPKDKDAGIISKVRTAVLHPDFDVRNFDNDIALFLLDNPEVYRRNITPICLPEASGKDHTGETGVVAGWGLLAFSGPLPTYLQETEVQIVSDEECDAWYSNRTNSVHISKASLCAGYREGFTDACTGDSGGPLMIQRRDGRWETVGIVSHGYKCAQLLSPGVYVNVTRYRPWIDKVKKELYEKRSQNLLGKK